VSPRSRPFDRLVLVALIVLLCSASAVTQPYLPAPQLGFNQAYRIGENAWGNCPLGTDSCPDRISSTGCLVSTMAAILDYYGVELSVSAGESCLRSWQSGMDPGILNDWLRAHDGFGACASDPVGNCCLAWERLPDVSVQFSSNQRDEGLDFLAERRIDNALAAGRPVVAGVHWSDSCSGGRGSEDCHWIVLTGKRGDTYVIIDPFNPDTTDPHGVRTTLDAGVLGRYTIDRFAVVSGPEHNVTAPSVSLHLAGGRSNRYAQGDVVRLNVEIRDARVPLRSYVRLAPPGGGRRFVPLPADGLAVSLSQTTTDWVAFHTKPTTYGIGSRPWVDLPVDRLAEGTWWWEVWLEDPMHPGSVVASARASFTVGVKSDPVAQSLAAIGVILVMAALAFVLGIGRSP